MNLHVGKLVSKVLKEKGIKSIELADRIHTSKQNLNNIFKREHIDTSILLKLCAALEYNFFLHFCEGELLSPTVKQEIAFLKQELKKANAKIDEANKEITYLKKINLLQDKVIGKMK
jgi:DNA-binding Xre family transcriptional regulator